MSSPALRRDGGLGQGPPHRLLHPSAPWPRASRGGRWAPLISTGSTKTGDRHARREHVLHHGLAERPRSWPPSDRHDGAPVPAGHHPALRTAVSVAARHQRGGRPTEARPHPARMPLRRGSQLCRRRASHPPPCSSTARAGGAARSRSGGGGEGCAGGGPWRPRVGGGAAFPIHRHAWRARRRRRRPVAATVPRAGQRRGAAARAQRARHRRVHTRRRRKLLIERCKADRPGRRTAAAERVGGCASLGREGGHEHRAAGHGAAAKDAAAAVGH